MELNLENPIMERKTKTVYRDNDKTIKLFVENYSKGNILNEALNQARVEEGTDLNIVMGLCVGHDSMFYKYSDALVTTLVTKDRVTGHNAVAPLHLANGYYAKLKEE